jgi:hypothetical protein
MARGIIDTNYIDFPDNIDQAYLSGLQTRSGLSFTDLAARMDAALAGLNAGIDHTLPRPQQVARQAHMLAIAGLELALGFTEDGLQAISLDDFQANVDAMVEALERMFRADVLYRLFSDDEFPVAGNGVIQTTATSPGFAGSGTGSNAFAGVYPDGTALGGGYTHYYRDATANRAAVIKSARDRLRRWHEPPFDLIGSATSIDALVALGTPDFVGAGSNLIRPADSTAEALVDAATYVGVFANDVRVWRSVLDFTDDHYALFKTYGQFNQRNPLVMRFDPLKTRDAYVRTRAFFPLAESVALWDYGINVNNRVGAALIRIAASGSYAEPTIAG